MFNSLKQLLQKDNERIIIVEEGQPRFVVLTFQEYQHLRSNVLEKSNTSSQNKEAGADQGVPRRTPAPKMREVIEEKWRGENLENLGRIPKVGELESGVKIEDLPF